MVRRPTGKTAASTYYDYMFQRGTKRAPNRTADRKISYDVAADGGCVFWPDMALSPYKAPKYIAKRTHLNDDDRCWLNTHPKSFHARARGLDAALGSILRFPPTADGARVAHESARVAVGHHGGPRLRFDHVFICTNVKSSRVSKQGSGGGRFVFGSRRGAGDGAAGQRTYIPSTGCTL